MKPLVNSMMNELSGALAPEGKHGFQKHGKVDEEAGENVYACTAIDSADDNQN